MVMCQIKNAYIIQQTRRDIEHGQGDLYSLLTIFGQLGYGMNVFTATYLCEVKKPHLMFAFSFVYYVIYGLQNFFLSDELEKDEYASTKDVAYLSYERR